MSTTESNDIQALRDCLKDSTVSGPWRLTVWEKEGHPPSYIFSEEHASEGSCPNERGISDTLRDILAKTTKTEVFIEHFIHAEDITNPKKSEQAACSSQSTSILNGLRLCLEVVRLTRTEQSGRIHFCDPRCDIVSVMPDGKVYEAIEEHVRRLSREDNIPEALLTIYEAFIHPLLSVVPDSKIMLGRFSGAIKEARQQMTAPQLSFFDEMWQADVVASIKNLTLTYSAMHKSNNVTNIDDFMKQYTRTINKFMDTWLLAKMFHSENNGMSSSVLYLGSLHSLNIEKYLGLHGYSRASIYENENMAACLKIR
ncbi:unnamed protein product [Ectocarpus sp. 6 AP-2014]